MPPVSFSVGLKRIFPQDHSKVTSESNKRPKNASQEVSLNNLFVGHEFNIFNYDHSSYFELLKNFVVGGGNVNIYPLEDVCIGKYLFKLSPIQYWINQSHFEIVKFLIDEGKALLDPIPCHETLIPLPVWAWAAKNNNSKDKIANYILDHKNYAPNMIEKRILRNFFAKSANFNRLEINLKNLEVITDYFIDNKCQNLLYDILKNPSNNADVNVNQTNKCIELLLNAGARVSLLDKSNQFVLLILTVKNNNPVALKMMIDAGALVHVTTQVASSLLTLTIYDGFVDCFKLLLTATKNRHFKNLSYEQLIEYLNKSAVPHVKDQFLAIYQELYCDEIFSHLDFILKANPPIEILNYGISNEIIFDENFFDSKSIHSDETLVEDFSMSNLEDFLSNEVDVNAKGLRKKLLDIINFAIENNRVDIILMMLTYQVNFLKIPAGLSHPFFKAVENNKFDIVKLFFTTGLIFNYNYMGLELILNEAIKHNYIEILKLFAYSDYLCEGLKEEFKTQVEAIIKASITDSMN